ncbi:hypothetical protein BDF20DRAFT_590637 [Mycotypha africana]|uniref:uncharacterized protein n=1 Tax=Mycotypha africana TaxID=64632 RepID=UPI0023019829|nr:uncharacterized protein BDF20DRAFT_590637 [Mycotypha africana]KAI8975178.1 hypothetical protein BDF20DRAFT_590637 [Mycotypha africana]
MNSGQLRTWPKVSMISNRMRIESAIEKVRKSLRSSSRREDRNRKQQHNTADVLNNKLNVALSDEYGNSNNSDAGSGDELMFMARRRLSMPNGSLSSHQSSDQLPNSITDKELLHEQKKRRRFMAQFSQSPQRDLVDKTSNNSSSHTLLSSGSTARRASMSNGKSQPPTATPAIIVSGGSAFTASDAYLSSDSSSSFEPGDDDDALYDCT